MSQKGMWGIVGVLTVIIIALAVTLMVVPAPAHAPTTSATSTPTTTTAQQPLHDKVIVTMPTANATVGKSFTVEGQAPGNWYFEASFPVQVRDKDNNKVGQGIAQAQSDWMTTAQVPFKADITVTGYSGVATLVLLRDNPSGMPENDDSITVPITVQ